MKFFWRYLPSKLSPGGLGRGLVAGSGIMLAGMACTFLVGVLLARGLGAAGYGLYGVVMALVAGAIVPAKMGLPQLLTREVSALTAHHDWDSARSLINWSAWRSMVASCVVVALLFPLSAALMPSVAGHLPALWLGAALVPLVVANGLGGGVLRGMQHVVLGQLPDTLVRPGVHALLLGGLYWCSATLTPTLAMLSGVLAAGTGAVLVLVAIRRLLPRSEVRIPAGLNERAWLASAYPMAITEGLQVLQSQAAIMVLAVGSSLGSTGLFRVAASASALVAAPMTLFNLVAAPNVARLHALGSRRELQRVLGWVAAGMTLCVSGLSLPFMLAGERVMTLLFGQEFAASAPVMRVLCLGFIGSSCFGASGMLLNMCGLHRHVTRASLLSLSVLTVALLSTVPVWGALGAAWSASGALVLWQAVLWLVGRTHLGLDSSVAGLFSETRE